MTETMLLTIGVVVLIVICYSESKDTVDYFKKKGNE